MSYHSCVSEIRALLMRTSSQNSLYLLVVISVNHRYNFVELDSSALCQSLGISTDPSLYSVPKGAYEADMYTTNCSIRL